MIADIIKKSGIPHELYYSFTGIDPPEVVRFIKKHYPTCIFLRPRKSFWAFIETHNPPLVSARWCCQDLKKRPSAKIPIKDRVLGIRKEESHRRAQYPQIDTYHKKWTMYYPILNWTSLDVWNHIERNELPYCELYDEGFDRIGCIVCPYHSGPNGALHNLYRRRWPGYFRVFERSVARWYFKRKNAGRDMAYDSPESYLHAWYRGQAWWYAGR